MSNCLDIHNLSSLDLIKESSDELCTMSSGKLFHIFIVQWPKTNLGVVWHENLYLILSQLLMVYFKKSDFCSK